MMAVVVVGYAQTTCCRYDLPTPNRNQFGVSLEYHTGRFYLFFNQTGPPLVGAGSGVLMLDDNGAVGSMEHWSDGVTNFSSGRNAVGNTQDMGFIVPGLSVDTNGWRSMGIRRLDASGQTMWSRIHTDPVHEFFPAQAVEAPNGSIAVVGYRSGSNLVNGMVWLLDADGELLWDQVYTGPLGHSPKHIDVHPLGGFLVSGTYNYNNCNSEAWLMRITDTGAIVWSTVHGGPFRDGLGTMTVLEDGSVMAIGSSRNDCNSSSNYQNWLARYDTAGTLLWQTDIGVPGPRAFHSIGLLPDSSGVVMAGQDRVGTLYTGWLCKYTLDGEQVWCQSIPYDDGVIFNVNSAFYDLVILEDGRLAVTGAIWTQTATGLDSWFMLLDEYGVPIEDITVGAHTMLESESPTASMLCHPNPTQGPMTCSLHTAGSFGTGQWSVRDMLGRSHAVYATNGLAEFDLDRLGLAPGSYWVQYWSAETGVVVSHVVLVGGR